MSKDYSEIAYKHTRFFVEECGERIAGTAQMNKAAEHAVEVFRSLGMKYIQHHFQVPVCSTEKSVVELISNKQITPLHRYTRGWLNSGSCTYTFRRQENGCYRRDLSYQ